MTPELNANQAPAVNEEIPELNVCREKVDPMRLWNAAKNDPEKAQERLREIQALAEQVNGSEEKTETKTDSKSAYMEALAEFLDNLLYIITVTRMLRSLGLETRLRFAEIKQDANGDLQWKEMGDMGDLQSFTDLMFADCPVCPDCGCRHPVDEDDSTAGIDPSSFK